MCVESVVSVSVCVCVSYVSAFFLHWVTLKRIALVYLMADAWWGEKKENRERNETEMSTCACVCMSKENERECVCVSEVTSIFEGSDGERRIDYFLSLSSESPELPCLNGLQDFVKTF